MNKTPITLIISLLMISLTAACNQTTDNMNSMTKKTLSLETFEAKDFSNLLSITKANLEKAKKVGGEWRDSGKMLKKALAKAQQGDYPAALKLLKVVNFQAKRGYQQSMAQKNIGNPDYLY